MKELLQETVKGLISIQDILDQAYFRYKDPTYLTAAHKLYQIRNKLQEAVNEQRTPSPIQST